MRLSQFPAPRAIPSKVHVVYADYDSRHFRIMQAGFRSLAGIPDINIRYFDNQERALHHVRNTATFVPTIAVFDVLAPLSRLRSVDCAKRLLGSGLANLKMVTLTSEDTGYINDHEEEIRKAGGEFWKKNTDDVMMILWISRSLKEGKVLPKEEFLEVMGEQRRSFVER